MYIYIYTYYIYIYAHHYRSMFSNHLPSGHFTWLWNMARTPKAPPAAYDEELETETSEQRDLWICSARTLMPAVAMVIPG